MSRRVGERGSNVILKGGPELVLKQLRSSLHSYGGIQLLYVVAQ